MWLVDLEHLDVVAGEEAHEACSVGAGRLDTDPADLTERKEPGQRMISRLESRRRLMAVMWRALLAGRRG